MYFSRFARRVVILLRGDSLGAGMSQYLVDAIGTVPNIEVWTKTEVIEAVGSERLEALVLSREEGRTTETVPTCALFVFIGAMPHTDWLEGCVARDEQGFILSGLDALDEGDSHAHRDRLPYLLETSVPGVFVAGDARRGSVKRVASAVGEGSMAVMYVHRYLRSS
jgi:thioredoxin reductase (NADPH)